MYSEGPAGRARVLDMCGGVYGGRGLWEGHATGITVMRPGQCVEKEFPGSYSSAASQAFGGMMRGRKNGRTRRNAGGGMCIVRQRVMYCRSCIWIDIRGVFGGQSLAFSLPATMRAAETCCRRSHPCSNCLLHSRRRPQTTLQLLPPPRRLGADPVMMLPPARAKNTVSDIPRFR